MTPDTYAQFFTVLLLETALRLADEDFKGRSGDVYSILGIFEKWHSQCSNMWVEY